MYSKYILLTASFFKKCTFSMNIPCFRIKYKELDSEITKNGL